MALNYKTIKDSAKAMHQRVYSDAVEVGEIWRERVQVTVSKLTEPRRTALKWRWFAKPLGNTATLGKGTRAAMLFGAGYSSKDRAVEALIEASAKNAATATSAPAAA